jgi:hypothetical protein
MDWAPPINSLTLFDIRGQGQPPVIGQLPPECQYCMEILYNPALFPCEITTCHHRFHRDCLTQQWCNNNAGNTLQACRCPTCGSIFNSDTQLTDLTPQVNARLQQLEDEAQAAQVEPQAAEAGHVEPQAVQVQGNNLQIYTQKNYLIDRATKRFIDCIDQILNDSWQRIAHAYPQPHHQNRKNWEQFEYIAIQTRVIDKIIQNYKNNPLFQTMLRENIDFLRTMNDRLQNPEFIQSLKTIQGYLAEYGKGTILRDADKGRILKMFLLQCYSGQIRRLDSYAPNEQINWPGQLPDLFIDELTTYFPRSTTPEYVNLMPVASMFDVPYRNPDLQFFQRYFQCFVDFLTELLEVNYNQAFQQQEQQEQQGGKQTTRKRRNKNKRTRKGFKRTKK